MKKKREFMTPWRISIQWKFRQKSVWRMADDDFDLSDMTTKADSDGMAVISASSKCKPRLRILKIVRMEISIKRACVDRWPGWHDAELHFCDATPANQRISCTHHHPITQHGDWNQACSSGVWVLVALLKIYVEQYITVNRYFVLFS